MPTTIEKRDSETALGEARSTYNIAKVCRTCLTWRPITDFRKRGDIRRTECRECHNASERARRSLKRTAKNRRTIEQLVLQIKNEANDRLVRLLCRSALNNFGSIQEFVQCWADHIERAKRATRPLKGTLDAFSAVVRLIEASQVPQPPAETLSDEDLEREMSLAIESLVGERPEVAVDALRRAGWVITPADDSRGEA